MSEIVTLRGDKGRAVEVLAAGGSVRTAAAEAGVTERTVHRWQKEPAFTAALQAQQRAMLDTVSARLLSLGALACERLREALNGEASAEQRRAADSVIKHILSVRQLVDVEARIAALEEALRAGER